MNDVDRPTVFLVAARHQAERGNAQLALRYVREFLSAIDFSASRTELPELIVVADLVYSHDGRREALLIYEMAADSGIIHTIGVVRQAECLIDNGKHEQALDCLRSVEHNLDCWGLCVFASALARTGDFDQANSIFQAICTSHPSVRHFWHRWFTWSIIEGDASNPIVSVFLRMVDEYSPDSSRYYRFIASLREGRIAAACEIFLSCESVRSELTLWDVVPLLYGFVESDNEEQFEKVSSIILQQFGAESAVYKPLIDRACRFRDWNRANEIIKQADRLGLIDNDVELAIKAFEVACFSGDRPVARRYFESFQVSELDARFVAPLYRYMADNGLFQALVDDFLSRLDAGQAPFGVDNLIVRAVRKTNSHERVLSSLSSRITSSGLSASINFFLVIFQDWIFCTKGGEFDDDGRVLIRSLRPFMNAVVKRRIDIECEIADLGGLSGAHAAGECAIYFCTNRSYLCGAATAFFSLLLNNPGIGSLADFFIVAESNDEALVVEIFGAIADYFDVDVSVVNEDVIKKSGVVLKEDYGLFTGGVTLASAAYYRIYFARYLKSLAKYTRAVYIDSDVVVNAGLNALFSLDMQGFSLAARLEVDKPEVRAAVCAHGLPEGMYFNSGVLVFDFNSSEIDSRLERAIEVAENDSDRLLFQDQCALNIGFVGDFLPIEHRFNFFVEPHGVSPDFEAVYLSSIVHYLDRPKPWDSLYSKSVGFIWLSHWQKLSAILSPGVARELYEAAARA